MALFKPFLAAIAAVLLIGVAEAARNSSPMGSNQKIYTNRVEGTRAYYEFCTRYPDECVVDLSEPERITMTSEVWTALNTVTREVNHTLIPVEDMTHWGVSDRWDFAEDGKGDCEDFQLVKRKRLREGYHLPQRAMRMTVVFDDIGEGHAVLTVLTDRGDFILDNKNDLVLPWSTVVLAGYEFLKREGSVGSDWVALRPALNATRRVALLRRDTHLSQH